MPYLALLMLLAALTGCAGLESETEIPLSEVPDAALAAAQAEVPGFEVTEAEIEEEDGQKVYELEGTANGKEYEIEVSGTGEILEVEEQ